MIFEIKRFKIKTNPILSEGNKIIFYDFLENSLLNFRVKSDGNTNKKIKGIQ